MFSECIVHAGVEKTGTTSIQQFLSLNRAALREKGVVYPVAPGGDNHSALAVYCLRDDNFSDDQRIIRGITNARALSQFRTKFRNNLNNELARVENQADAKLVFSNEHIHSRLCTIEELERLKELLEPLAERLRIIVYLRRQDAVAVSVYSTMVKYGLSPPKIFPDPSAWADSYYGYLDMMTRFEDVFGKDAITARVYQPDHLVGGDVISDFCDAIELDPEGLERSSRSNVSLNVEGQEFLRVLNTVMPRISGGKLNRARVKLDNSGLIGAVEKFYSGRGRMPSLANAKKFYERFREANEELRERYLPDLPAPLFSEDFSEYEQQPGEQKSVETLTFADAVKIAARVFAMLIEKESE